jgi:hypothetical protein
MESQVSESDVLVNTYIGVFLQDLGVMKKDACPADWLTADLKWPKAQFADSHSFDVSRCDSFDTHPYDDATLLPSLLPTLPNGEATVQALERTLRRHQLNA